MMQLGVEMATPESESLSGPYVSVKNSAKTSFSFVITAPKV